MHAHSTNAPFKNEDGSDDPRNVPCKILAVEVDNPVCVHGPAIKMERSGSVFYACSVDRDGGCGFAHNVSKEGDVVGRNKRQKWEDRRSEYVEENRKKFPSEDFLLTLRRGGVRAWYCRTCKTLITDKGHEHEALELESRSVASPVSSGLLDQLAASKREAQFHFDGEALDVLTDNLEKNGADRVVCVGAPTIAERLWKSSNKSGIKCLLLDFDVRLGQFFTCGSEWCWYNMFNHSFFLGAESKDAFETFISGAEKLAIVTDPPFGGRVELVSRCLASISEDWKRVRSKGAEEPILFWIFPYFMETKINSASSTPLHMSDYQVNYVNHASFGSVGTAKRARKKGSPVRFFTNLPLSAIRLPSKDGRYRFCDDCSIWVSSTNNHCSACNSCTSKDGSTYAHCDVCSRCVKESWRHCNECGRCALPQHPCELFKRKKNDVAVSTKKKMKKKSRSKRQRRQ